MVWSGNLHSCRQVEDNSLVTQSSLAPGFLDFFANSYRKVRLGLGERFWAILVLELSSVLCRVFVDEFPYELGMGDRKLDSFVLRVAEYNVAEAWAACIVHVQNGFFGTSQSLECSGNEISPSRGQNLSSKY